MEVRLQSKNPLQERLCGMELQQTLEGHLDRVWCAEWSPEGTMLASCSGDKTVRIWTENARTNAWECSAILEETHHRTIRSCSWSPDGRCLATASFDATTAIWERQGPDWEQVAVLEGHENEVKGVAWSPSGMLLATCSRDKTVWIWEAEPGHEYECVDVKHGHSQDVKSVRWHPSGEVLVSTSYDDSIKLWVDAHDEWVCAQTLSDPGSGHSSTVWATAFSPDGTAMVSCSDDKTLRIWDCHFAKDLTARVRSFLSLKSDCKAGYREPKWKLMSSLSGYHDRTIFSVDWSKQNVIATGSSDNGIRIFSITLPEKTPEQNVRGAPAIELQHYEQAAHASDVNCVRWHPTKPHILVSTSDDNSLRIWHVKLPESI